MQEEWGKYLWTVRLGLKAHMEDGAVSIKKTLFFYLQLLQNLQGKISTVRNLFLLEVCSKNQII